MPEVSIIVPVYKAELFLNKCIESILNQTFSDFELILVDDGSPDNCPAICDQYARQDPRVHVIHQENSGVSAARNAGMAYASGTYLMFCDSDDYVEPDWCHIMVDISKKYPEHGVVCNAWRENIHTNIRTAYTNCQNNHSKTIKSFFEIYTCGVSGSVCFQIFRHATIQQFGLCFEVGRAIGEDAAFCAQYSAHCEQHIFISKPLYHYISNPDSAMHQYYSNELELHLPLFLARLPLIHDDEMQEFCDIHFSYFMGMLQTVFDPRNSMSFLQKMKYNQRMMRSTAFRTCVNGMSGKNENPLVVKIVKLHNYYLYWLFEQIVKIKHKLRRKH